MSSHLQKIQLGQNISIDLVQKNGRFLGLGSIEVGGTTLRSSRRAMFVEIRNPSGVELLNYSLVECSGTPEELRLKFSMEKRANGIMEWMVHEIRNRYNTTDWTAEPQPAPDTTLEMVLRPVSRVIGGKTYSGFSYQYFYKSKDIAIYKILDRGSWEPGGHAVGSEFWMRNCFVPSVVKIESVEQFHSSEWYLPDCANPSIFQFLPLQTELQGFTFTASKEGVLATWINEVAHVRSLFEKPRGEDLLVHFHEHCGDLSHEFSTSPVEVLWSPGARTKVDVTNDYESVRDFIHEALHAQIGMRRERVTTYGQIEQWGPVDMERFRKVGLPKLLDVGIKTVYLSNHFENNMNTWSVGNMCCTVDLKVAETVGEDKLKAFCDDARKGGATVEMWGNTAISTLTTTFRHQDAPEDRIRFLPKGDTIMDAIDEKNGFVRNPSNAIEADHYTPVFAVLNLRDEAVRKYWLRRWKEAHDNVGLGGIFLDSSFNLSSDKFHYVQNAEAGRMGATADQVHLLGNYRPQHEPHAAILTQYRVHLDLMTEMQKIGYVYCNEDLGVFGIHRHGPGIEARLGNLSIWGECIAGFDLPVLQKAGGNPDEVYFQGLAYRMMWSIYWDIKRDALSFNYDGLRGDYDIPLAWHLEILRAYNQVESLMRQRTILPDEAGVIYRSGDKQVLWAFRDLALPLEQSSSVVDVLDGKTIETAKVEALRHHIYIISNR